MRNVNVVAAIITSTNECGEPIVFATQRGYGPYRGYWDFPGGKIEITDLSKQDALKREIMEELDTLIDVGKLVDIIEYDYQEFHLTMSCYLCKVIKGNLTLSEHLDSKWLTKQELQSVEWLPADALLITKIVDLL